MVRNNWTFDKSTISRVGSTYLCDPKEKWDCQDHNFQERISSLFYDLWQIVVYMDDLKALGFLDFDDHLTLLNEVLSRLSNAGFQVNPEKCHWFKHQVQYLGF